MSNIPILLRENLAEAEDLVHCIQTVLLRRPRARYIFSCELAIHQIFLAHNALGPCQNLFMRQHYGTISIKELKQKIKNYHTLFQEFPFNCFAIKKIKFTERVKRKN